MATTASDAARAVNALMGFSSGDQPALLEILQKYFTSPYGPESDDCDNDDDNSDDDTGDSEPLEGILHSCNISNIIFNN